MTEHEEEQAVKSRQQRIREYQEAIQSIQGEIDRITNGDRSLPVETTIQPRRSVVIGATKVY